jgi:glycosyltransferase involved in cell wall biosynthesis
VSKKLRILFHTEAPFAASGFGVYSKEILSRLHDTGKYEIGEFANYATVNHPEDNTKWPFYANVPSPGNPYIPDYNNNQAYQFGSWRFDRVALDFRPHIVQSVLDYWMDSYINISPYRRFFHWVEMPTYDSSPQRSEWIDTYCQADGILAYNDWALEELKKQGGGKMKCFKSAPPGIDTNLFTPTKDIAKVRNALGIPADINIVGMVARNQGRKLYPELFHAFRLFLDKCEEKGQHELAQKTFLLCHTSYPDLGWNLPQFLKEFGLINKVYFTYFCRHCGNIYLSLFQDARSICPKCNMPDGVFTNVSNGISREELVKIYQCMDLYVQYSNCGGFEMPQVEAASCGVPVMATDYSAMTDIVKKLDGFAIPVEKLYVELEMHSRRAYPSNTTFASLLYNFFTLEMNAQKHWGKLARDGVIKHYTWDNTAKIWESYFDSVQLKKEQGKWENPPKIPNPEPFREDLTYDNNVFVEWLITSVLCQPEKLNTYLHMSLVQQLNHGGQIGIKSFTPVTHKQIYDALHARAVNAAIWERARCGLIPLPREDYIEYANLKKEIYGGKNV